MGVTIQEQLNLFAFAIRWNGGKLKWDREKKHTQQSYRLISVDIRLNFNANTKEDEKKNKEICCTHTHELT